MKKSILVCGAGSIGKRHIRNVLQSGHDVIVWRQRSDLNQKLLEEFDKKITIADLDIHKAIESVDAVIVANNTIDHRGVIEKSIELAKHLYIEKPVDIDHKGLRNLMAQANKKNLVVEVGCQLRKHPSLIELKKIIDKENMKVLTFRMHVGQRLEYWRPGTDYRKSYSAQRKKGGGVLLDLIHEIDLCLWLLGEISEVYGTLSKVSDQEIDVHDLSNIIVNLESGSSGSIQLDLFSPSLRRGLEIISSDKILMWDYNQGGLEMIKKDVKETIFNPPMSFSRNDMFLEMMNHFLNRLDDEKITPACSFESGIRSLEIVNAIEESSLKKASIITSSFSGK